METLRTQLRISENMAEKIKVIAKKNERSMNSQITYIIKQYISDYEKFNGRIETEEKK